MINIFILGLQALSSRWMSLMLYELNHQVGYHYYHHLHFVVVVLLCFVILTIIITFG